MLRIAIVIAVAATTFAGCLAPVARAQSGSQMTTVQAVEACRAELGKHAKYMDVRACVVKKKKGE
jgi:hypothetical protein